MYKHMNDFIYVFIVLYSPFIVQTHGVEVSRCAMAVCLTDSCRSGFSFCEEDEWSLG